MARRAARILFYLVLALICYGIAAVAGGGIAFAIFLVAGAVGELAMWRELLFPARKPS